MNSSELEVTWKRVSRVWLSYLWRNIIAIVFTIIICLIVGAIVGFIMAHLGIKKSTAEWVAGIIGFIIGLIISIIPLKMIIGKDFGSFRLVLVSKNSTCDTK